LISHPPKTPDSLRHRLIILVPYGHYLILFVLSVIHDLKNNLDQVNLDRGIIGREVRGENVLQIVCVQTVLQLHFKLLSVLLVSFDHSVMLSVQSLKLLRHFGYFLTHLALVPVPFIL